MKRYFLYLKKTAFLLFTLTLLMLCASCSNVIVVDGDENSSSIKYNGNVYESQYFYNADADRILLGWAENGADVYAIGSHNPPKYILIEGSDNSGCFILSGNKVPTSGTVTKVLIDSSVRGDNSKYLSTDYELEMLEKITHITGESEEFTIHNYFTDGNAFYYVYDNSDVSCNDNYGGYIAYTNGKWVFSAPGNSKEWGNNNTVTITAVVIEDNELIDEMCRTSLAENIDFDLRG